jgi:hypothetical protein
MFLGARHLIIFLNSRKPVMCLFNGPAGWEFAILARLRLSLELSTTTPTRWNDLGRAMS